MIRGQWGSKPLIIANTNYYTDENEFFGAPYLSEAEKSRQLAEKQFSKQQPTVNQTRLQELIDAEYTAKGDQPPMNIFPRWIAQA